MAALRIVLAFLTVVFLTFGQGSYSADCQNPSFTVRPTGAIVKGLPEFEVSIINDNCRCDQNFVTYNTTDFNSVEPVDPAIFKKYAGNQYEVNNFQSLPRPPKPPLKFKYAQARPATFKLASINIDC